MREPAWRLCAVVGACQIGQAVACEVVERRPAYLGSRDAGDAVAVAGDVVHVEDVAGEVAGRMDTCWDSSCGYPSQNASLPCKSGRARWNMRWKIAKGDIGSTGPGTCELACRREGAEQSQGGSGEEVVVVAAGITRARVRGRQDGWSVSLSSFARKQQQRRQHVRGGGRTATGQDRKGGGRAGTRDRF